MDRLKYDLMGPLFALSPRLSACREPLLPDVLIYGDVQSNIRALPVVPDYPGHLWDLAPAVRV